MAKKKPAKFESYVAHSSVKASASASAIASAYKIEVRFLGGLTTAQKNAFKSAADRWSKVIVGDVPSVTINGEVIDDILILAKGAPIDGVGGILGQAGPTHLRPASAGVNAFLPARAEMTFDSADLAAMQANGTLLDVITHEMGHCIGIGTIWPNKGLLAGATTSNPTFTGTNAKGEFGTLQGTGPAPVPVENTGGPGTRNSHWRETIFRNELMSGFIAAPGNPLSRMTAASLKDLGYVVDMTKAEPYTLPNHLNLLVSGVNLTSAEHEHSHALPFILPTVLNDDSLVVG